MFKRTCPRHSELQLGSSYPATPSLVQKPQISPNTEMSSRTGSEVPRTWSLMLCSGHLGILNNFIPEFVLCECSPMAPWTTMVLGVWSISSLWSCLLLPCYFPRTDSWLIATLPLPCNNCHLLPSALVGGLGTGTGGVGAEGVCPAHVGVGHGCGHFCPGLAAPWLIWRAPR